MASSGDDTRERILGAAWEQIRARGTAEATVAEIAAAAGVSRQLVYFHFANRAGLLTAMARHRDEASAFAAELAALRGLEPVAAFERLLGAWCDYVPEILPVARALEAALVSDADGASAWRDRMTELREILRAALERIERAGRLAAGWTPPAAADWAWARIQPSTWQHLVGERGWSPRAYRERTVASLLAELVA